jgi:DNA invertase Pin-like site-specific DNA recombinase
MQASGDVVAEGQSAAMAMISASGAAMTAAETSSCSVVPSVAPSVLAVGYVRTSSLANVGADRDSETRQRLAIEAHAARAGLTVQAWFTDPGVSGADAIDARPGFCAMLTYCAEHDINVIVLENASRFARDAMIAELGYRSLTKAGFTLIAADDPGAFVNATPTGDLIRGILSNVSQFEKANLVAKLKGSRDRRSAALGKRIEGRKGYDDTAPELVAAAKELRADGLTHRAISAALAARGFLTSTGRSFNAGQIGRLLAYSLAA